MTHAPTSNENHQNSLRPTAPTMNVESANGTEAQNQNVEVFLRLRALNEFELSRRSREVIEIVDEKRLNIDDPEQGDREIELDGVFRQGSSDEEIFEKSCHSIPGKLLDGFHCSIAAYGASATGKTSTVKSLLPLLSNSIFAKLDSGIDATEYTIRVSVIEVYLDRLRDLLHESSHVQIEQNGSLSGCASVSCVQASDVAALVERAMAVRTCSASDPNRDSNRSSLLFQLTLEQFNPQLQCSVISTLRVFDLASSELSNLNSDGTEAAEVAKSLTMLQKLVSESEEWRRNGVPHDLDNGPALLRLMQSFFAGNAYGTVLLTASPSNYASAETARTINFGESFRKIRTIPRTQVVERWQETNKVIQDMASHQNRLEQLVVALADECREQRGRAQTAGRFQTGNVKLWGIIENLPLPEDDNLKPIQFNVEGTSEHEARAQQFRLQTALRKAQLDRDSLASENGQLRSDLAIIQAENTTLSAKVKKLDSEVAIERLESSSLRALVEKQESSLSTSRFREREAVVYLRQIRRFYFRLLNRNAAEGSGDADDVAENIPGAPTLSHLHDMDAMMFESGLLEEDEIGQDAAVKDYKPSKMAMLKSSGEAEKALQQDDGFGVSDSPANIEHEQKKAGTPSGTYLTLRETLLETELTEVSKKCIDLQKMLTEERANVECITERVGMAAAFEKMRAAQEMKSLKDQLSAKTSDLKTVVWKMNELHMVGKSCSDQIRSRDDRIAELERNLIDLRNNTDLTKKDSLANVERQRCEIERLESLVQGFAKPVWHLKEDHAKSSALQSRIVAPFSVGKGLRSPVQRQLSIGESELNRTSNHTVVGISSRTRRRSSIQHNFTPDATDVVDDHDDDKSSDYVPDAVMNAPTSVNDLLFMDDDSEREPSISQYSVENTTNIPEETRQRSTDITLPQPEDTCETETKIKTTCVRAPANTSFTVNDREKSGATEACESDVSAVRTEVEDSLTGLPSSMNDTPSRDNSNSEREESSGSRNSGSRSKSSSGTEVSSPPVPPTPPSEEPDNKSGMAKPPTSTLEVQSHQNQPRDISYKSSGQHHPHKPANKSQAVPRHASTKGAANPKIGIVDRLRAQASKKLQESKTADDDNTPEWMQKFRTIASKNHDEAVIVTSGSVPPREATRTSFGEVLKHNKADDIKAVAEPPSKKWVPRKKETEDSLDDSFARNFLGGMAEYSSDTDNSASEGGALESEQAAGTSEVTAEDNSSDDESTVAPSVSKPSSTPVAPDSSSDDDSPVAPPVVKKKPVESDSESSDDESTVAPPASKPSPTPAAVKKAPDYESSDDESTVAPPVVKKKPLESDSESSDDDSTVAPPVAKKKPVESDSESSDDDSTVAPPVAKKKPVESDSESSDDDSTVAPPVVKKPVESDSDSSDDESAVAPPVVKKPVESDSESSDDESTVAPPVVKKPVESDSESSDDESTVAPPVVKKKPVESDSDSSDDESAVAPPMVKKKPVESDSESSDDESTVAPPVVKKKPVESDSDSSDDESTVAPPVVKKKPVESDSESSDDESTVAPPVVKKKPVESDSESSDDESTVAPPVVKKKPVESDSDSSDDESTVAPPVVKKKPVESDSESSDDESTVAPPVVKKKPVESDSESSDDESTVAPPKPTAAVQKKAVESDSESSEDDDSTVAPSGDKQPPAAGDSSSEEDSEDEKPPEKSTSTPSIAAGSEFDKSDVSDDEDDPFNDNGGIDPFGPSRHERKETDSFFSGAQPNHQSPRRDAGDFHNQVTTAVTSNLPATQKQRSPKRKSQFVIKDGKLVKDTNAKLRESPALQRENSKAKFVIKNGKLVRNGSSTSVQNSDSKAKFVIKNGKLVKDESKLGALMGKAKKGKSRRNSLDSKTEELQDLDREERKEQMTEKKRPTKGSKMLAAVGRAMGGGSSKKKPGFSIVNGKLVKDGSTKKPKQKTDKKKREKKEKKEKRLSF